MSWNIIQRIREGQKVPTADASTNVYVNDVVGNKTDAATATVGTTATAVAYIKGLLGLHPVPTADATTNTNVRDVVGNKTDAEVAAVGTTKSVLAYLKGLVRRLDMGSQPVITRHTAPGNGAYVDIVNITNKGILKGIYFQTTTPGATGNSLAILITIDGVNKLDGIVVNTAVIANDVQTGTIYCDLPFATSLLVQHKVDNTAQVAAITVVSYTTDA